MTRASRRFSFTPWLFLAPALSLIALFTFWPFAWGVWLAFCDWDMLARDAGGHAISPRFVGLANFHELMHDRWFWGALGNSLRYLLVVPVLQFASMGLAVLVNQRLRGLAFYRAALYLPVVTSVVVVGVAWHWVYQSDGPLGWLLTDTLHVFPRRIGWLTEAPIALYSVMFVTAWQGVGYFMVLYLAGLGAIPPQYEEAARIDGASSWQVFRHVTVPLLRPTLTLCTIISCISAFKVFTEIYVMTRGGPEHATTTLGYYIFEVAFIEYRMGYAAALSLVLGVLVGVISWLNARFFREGGLQSYE